MKQELKDIIDTKHTYHIDNIYDENRILQIVNKKNNTNIILEDVVFDKVGESEISFYAKEASEHFAGRVYINYKLDKHYPYIIWMICNIALLLITITVVLPIGISNMNWPIIITSGCLIGVVFISAISDLIIWPSGVIKTKKAKLDA